MDEKLKKIIIYVSAGFVILIIILFAISSCQGKSANFEDYQKNMEKAAKNFYENHEDELPTEDKKTSEYSLKEMITNGDVEDYTKAFGDESIKCDGGVTVINNNGYYLYTSELDCGDAYSSNTLSKKIKEDNLTESGQGLYEMGDNYVFRGEQVNNYASFNGETWRIISIDSSDNIYLLQEKSSKDCTFDNHYNIEESETGINIFYQGEGKNSNMMTCLQKIYDEKISDEAKAYLSTQRVCYGARSEADTTNDGSTECSIFIDKQELNLLAIYEYIRASIDDDCKSISSRTCRNYNWLARDHSTYLITPSARNTYMSYYKDENEIEETYANNYLPVLLKISINGKVNYTTGNGTEDSPYQIGDVAKKKK